MYGLPKDFNPSPFVGATLRQVSFSENTIHFVFENEIAITLEGSFSHVREGRVETARVPVGTSALMRLVGRSIKASEATPDGLLRLVFDNDDVLVCIDDSADFESYRIRLGGMEIIV